MKRIGIVALSASAGVLLLGGAAFGVGAFNAPPAPAPSPANVVVSNPSPSPSATANDGAVTSDIETTPIPAPPTDPTKCPAGTAPNAVDENGNESDCQPTNSQGQRCVAYDANNKCTQYYKP